MLGTCTCDARGVAGTRVAERLAALRELWANPGLRRAELAWGGFHTAEWASLVALAVVAFASDGAAAVGVVLFARMVPSALVAPLVAVAGDRAALSPRPTRRGGSGTRSRARRAP